METVVNVFVPVYSYTPLIFLKLVKSFFEGENYSRAILFEPKMITNNCHVTNVYGR